MTTTVDDVLARVRAARGLADLFADTTDARRYRELAKLIHPDRVPPRLRAAATEAFAKLARLWEAAHRLDVGGYRVTGRSGHDDVADYLRGDGVILKVAHRPVDNDLMRREAEHLGRVRRATPVARRAYLPELRDSLTYCDEGTGACRVVNVFTTVEGAISLAAVGAAFPDGLDARDVAWMWRRLLVALGIAHRAGVVHGAVVPEHILLLPAEHGLVLANWCYSTTGDHVPALVARYRDWYAPEIPRRGRPTPGSDIYLASRCMLTLMGAHAPTLLARFARGCLLASPAARPDDAWRLLAELDDVLRRLYGQRRFRPFAVPATVPSWPDA